MSTSRERNHLPARALALLMLCSATGGCATEHVEGLQRDAIAFGVQVGHAVGLGREQLGTVFAGLLEQRGYRFSDLFGDPREEQAAYEELARIEGCEDAVEIIKKASEATEISANYLLALARQERSCRADARASTSTAYGMFQFIETTWLVAIHRHGGKYGEQRLAEAVAIDLGGRPVLRQPAMRDDILAARGDAQLAAYLAAEFARENAEHIRRYCDRPLTATGLYMAYFLGAHGATQFLAALDREPDKRASDLLPRVAEANPSVFFERGDRSRPRTVASVYSLFQQKVEIA